MPADFLPRRESGLLSWSANFRRKISQSPEHFGLTADQAAAYAAAQDEFAQAYQLANQSSTRTPSGIVRKDAAKRALEKLTRELAAVVRTAQNSDDSKRFALGLSIANAGGYRPALGRPRTAPGVRILSVDGRRVRVRAYDVESPHRRAKPRGCRGVVYFTYVGDLPPADRAQWRFAGQSGRLTFMIDFEPEVEPFAKVWIAAHWSNPRGEAGPMSRWVSTHVLPGVATAA